MNKIFNGSGPADFISIQVKRTWDEKDEIVRRKSDGHFPLFCNMEIHMSHAIEALAALHTIILI